MGVILRFELRRSGVHGKTFRNSNQDIFWGIFLLSFSMLFSQGFGPKDNWRDQPVLVGTHFAIRTLAFRGAVGRTSRFELWHCWELWETLRGSNPGISVRRIEFSLCMLCSQEVWAGGKYQSPAEGIWPSFCDLNYGSLGVLGRHCVQKV